MLMSRAEPKLCSRVGNPRQWLLPKQFWAGLAIFACCQLPGQATPVFQDQSDIGRDLKVPVHQWSDNTKQDKGIVVAVQGMTLYGKTYDALARHLVGRGYTVYAPDLRGFGDWKNRPAEFGGNSEIHFTKSKEDLTKVLTALRRKYPDKPIYCLGESLGANYAIWEASTDPHLIDGIIVSGTCYRMRIHPGPRWIVDISKSLVRPKRPVNLVPYMRPILSQDKKITEECMSDPEMRLAMKASDLIKSSITTKRTMEQVANIPKSLPVLFISGGKDKIQNTKAIPSLVKKMGSKRVTVVVLEQKGHLLLEHQPLDPVIAKTIDDWLEKNAVSADSRITTLETTVESVLRLP